MHVPDSGHDECVIKVDARGFHPFRAVWLQYVQGIKRQLNMVIQKFKVYVMQPQNVAPVHRAFHLRRDTEQTHRLPWLQTH